MLDSKLAMVHKIIYEMLLHDMMQHSNCEWNFPLILVPKSDAIMGPVTDCREMNKQTIPDRSLLPMISDLLRWLGTENTLYTFSSDTKSAF